MKKLAIHLLIWALPLQAASNSCDLTISACEALVKAQDTQAEHLKQEVKQLEHKLEQEADPLIPWWAWGIIGEIAGGFIVYELKK